MAHANNHTHITPAERSITETAPKATFIMLLSGLFLLLIMTVISANSSTPAELSKILGPLSLYAGIGSGGFFCGMRLRGADKFVCAVVSATALTAVLLAVKIIIPAPEERLSLVFGVIFHILAILIAIMGALVADKLPKRKRRKKSKHRS